LYNVVLVIVFGFQFSKEKFSGFGLTHNWIKQSIFWELLYWKTNILHHNLDFMDIEKNVFENIFNIVIDSLTNHNYWQFFFPDYFCLWLCRQVLCQWIVRINTNKKIPMINLKILVVFLVISIKMEIKEEQLATTLVAQLVFNNLPK
jgi:hypothetical protein